MRRRTNLHETEHETPAYTTHSVSNTQALKVPADEPCVTFLRQRRGYYAVVLGEGDAKKPAETSRRDTLLNRAMTTEGVYPGVKSWGHLSCSIREEKPRSRYTTLPSKVFCFVQVGELDKIVRGKLLVCLIV